MHSPTTGTDLSELIRGTVVEAYRPLGLETTNIPKGALGVVVMDAAPQTHWCTVQWFTVDPANSTVILAGICTAAPDDVTVVRKAEG